MRYLSGNLYSIALHDDAVKDLETLRLQDDEAAADIEVFLEEARDSQETLDNLTRNGYVNYGDCPFDVTEWGEAKRAKYNLWRLKFLFVQGAASKYRIIYAFHTVENRYYVLAIVHRNFEYRLADTRSKRILAAYDKLDIPRH